MKNLFLNMMFFCLLSLAPLTVTAESDAISSRELADSIDRIELSLSRLNDLIEQPGDSTETDDEALVFRLDQRIIRLIYDVEKLVRYKDSLAEDDPDRVRLEKRMRQDLSNTDQKVFKRIQELEQRIRENDKRLKEAASDSEKFALQAYLHSLEGLRIGFYASLVALIEIREKLYVIRTFWTDCIPI